MDNKLRIKTIFCHRRHVPAYNDTGGTFHPAVNESEMFEVGHDDVISIDHGDKQDFEVWIRYADGTLARIPAWAVHVILYFPMETKGEDNGI